MPDNRALPTLNDVIKAIRVNLDSWRNADGSPLTTAQVDAIIAYLTSPGSGDGGPQGRSYADWVLAQLELTRPYPVNPVTGEPLAGFTYGFTGGANNTEAA